MGILRSIFCCCRDTTEQASADLTTTLVTDADNPSINDISPMPCAEDNGEAGNYLAPASPISAVNSHALAPVTTESLTSTLHRTPPRRTTPGSSHSSPASVSSAASSRNNSPTLTFCND